MSVVIGWADRLPGSGTGYGRGDGGRVLDLDLGLARNYVLASCQPTSPKLGLVCGGGKHNKMCACADLEAIMSPPECEVKFLIDL